MKRFYFFFCLTILTVFLVVCCSNLIQVAAYPQESSPSENTVTIFRVSRDVFQSFLLDPRSDIIITSDSQRSVCSQDDSGYETASNTYLPIRQELLGFAGNQQTFSEYLSQNSVAGNIETLFLIDTPNVPITIFCQTSTDIVFVTINEIGIESAPSQNAYTYTLYTQRQYIEKFQKVTATFQVLGKSITDYEKVTLYNNYAEIPLISTLKAVGANFIQLTYYKYIVQYKNNLYYLDVKQSVFQEMDSRASNLLAPLGGVTFTSVDGAELIVDTSTLHFILSTMDENIHVKCNRESKSVTVSYSSTAKESALRSGIVINLPLIVLIVSMFLTGFACLRKYHIRAQRTQRSTGGQGRWTGDGSKPLKKS